MDGRLEGDNRVVSVRCEHFEFVPCRLPEWRVVWDEPKDLKAPPEIPEGAEWKHWPVD